MNVKEFFSVNKRWFGGNNYLNTDVNVFMDDDKTTIEQVYEDLIKFMYNN